MDIANENTFKHLQKEKSFKDIIFYNSVVCCIPQYVNINDFIQFLSQYGVIICYKYINNCQNKILVEFKYRKNVKFLLSKEIIFKDVGLNIYQAKYDYKLYEDKCSDIIYDNVKEVLNVKTTFENQLKKFLERISLTSKDIKMRYEPVCQELEKIFQSKFLKCKIYAFGSTVVGLGFINSDLDIYLDPGLIVIEDDKNSTGPHVISHQNLFLTVANIIKSNPNIFSKCIPIRQAKMPIIKFIYKPTDIQCDISVKNDLAVYNSKLVKFYLSIEPCFQQTMMIIKYWAHNINDIVVTKYALTMLFIFYIQNLKLVPPVDELKKNCPVAVTIKGWQVNFNNTVTIFQNNNYYWNKDIPKLLQGFFEFYAYYDFKTHVICPCDGHSYDKELFMDIENLPASMARYKEYLKNNSDYAMLSVWKPMCLQDPNQLNHNLTNNVTDICLKKFQTYCFIAAGIIRDSARKDYQDLLLNIFKADNYFVDSDSVSCEKSCTFFIYPNDFLNISNRNVQNKWFNIIFHIIKQYLEQVLNLQVQIKEDKEPLDGKKLKNIENANNDNGLIVILHCKGKHCLWSCRKNIKIPLTFSHPLQKEIQISNKILEKMNLNNNDSHVIIDFDCHLIKKTEPNVHLELFLQDNKCREKIFSDLTKYLRVQLPKIIKKTINVMNNINKNIFIDTTQSVKL